METIDGDLGAQMRLTVENGVAEFMVISYWDPRKAQEAIGKIAGGNMTDAWFLAKGRDYSIDPGTSV